MKRIPANQPTQYLADTRGLVIVLMDGSEKEPDLRRRKIIHRVIERIDIRIERLVAIRNRLVELEQRNNERADS